MSTLASDPPHRRFRFLFDAHANTREELARTLDEAERALDDWDEDTEPMTFEHTSGGVQSGWHLRMSEDPTMTPERYQAELDQWLAECKASAHSTPEIST